MTKKYFFFDIDGTLGLGISSIIPADTLYCLRRLVQEAISSPSRRAACSTTRRPLPTAMAYRPSSPTAATACPWTAKSWK